MPVRYRAVDNRRIGAAFYILPIPSPRGHFVNVFIFPNSLKLCTMVDSMLWHMCVWEDMCARDRSIVTECVYVLVRLCDGAALCMMKAVT